MMRRRRGAEELSISFLDVITCGFGAIILLLMIAKIGEPQALEPGPPDLSGRVAALQEELYEIRGQTTVLDRELDAKHEQLSQWKERVARLRAELEGVKERQASRARDATLNETVKGQLSQALQELTAEMERLLARAGRRDDSLIGGIPVDSEYIIFIIDTSGSMFRYSWDLMLEQFVEVLEIYPEVKGIQVMNDMGQYMFTNYRGQWIADTPGRRRAIIQRLRTWNAFSNSSPVEGITAAIRTYYRPDRKISLYVFGDEFTGPSIKDVVDTVERINRKDAQGNPMVRIHGVGFPVQFANPPHLQMTGIRFAALMREIARRNGGTFVGLNKFY